MTNLIPISSSETVTVFTDAAAGVTVHTQSIQVMPAWQLVLVGVVALVGLCLGFGWGWSKRQRED